MKFKFNTNKTLDIISTSFLSNVQISKIIPYFVFLIAIITGLYGFFDRYPIFHDEIINIYRAENGIIFSALRPVFYFINYFAYNFLGQYPRSITLMAVFSYAFTSLFLYKIGRHQYGIMSGLFCAAIYMFLPLVINIGVRGMPHIHAGFFATLTLYLISLVYTSNDIRKVVVFLGFAGIVNILTLATHPSMVGFSFSLILWALAGLIIKGKYINFIFPVHIKQMHYVIFLIATFISIIILNYLYKENHSRSYFSHFIALFERVQIESRPSQAGWSKPGLWYFSALAKHGSTLNYLVPLVATYTLLVLIFIKRIRSVKLIPFGFSICIIVCSILFLTILSYTSWKHDRILVSFIPFYALTSGLIVGFVYKLLNGHINKIFHTGLYIIILLLIVHKGIVYQNDFINRSRNNQLRVRDRYYSLYAQLVDIPTAKIGVVGGRSNQLFARRYISISKKEYFNLEVETSNLVTSNGKENLISTLISNNVDHIILPTQDPSQAYFEVAKWMSSIGAQRVYSWRGLYEIWRFQFIQYSTDFANSLTQLERRARIGVYAGEAEVGEHFYKRFQFISNDFNLRLYNLNSARRTAEQNMYYLDRNNVNAALLPLKPVGSVSDEKLVEMKTFFKNSGWYKKGYSPLLELELWLRE